MAEAAAAYTGLEAIHVISHGDAGGLWLGSTHLDNGNLADYAGPLSRLGASLAAGGDLLLYGCNVAAGETGLRFIQQLAALTGADVAASNDLTGAAAQGGNWTLESATGPIDSAPPDAAALAAYTGTLDALTGTDGDDILNGTAGNDVIYGLGGNDTIDAGAGSDVVDAGAGDDAISVVANSGESDTVSGGDGTDSLGADFSGNSSGQLYWRGYNASGAATNWVSSGNSMADIQAMLVGAAKFSAMAGQAYGVTFDGIENLSVKASSQASFNDLLIVQGTGSYDGKAGTDTLYADWSATTTPITWNNDPAATEVVNGVTVPKSQTVNGSTVTSVERLLLTTGSGDDTLSNTQVATDDVFITGDGNDTINAGDGNDRIEAGAGNDVLNGGAGSDTMIGGAGDDTYIVDNSGDKITENASEGTDTLLASVSYTLPANVENLTLTGTAAINATGNSGDNTLLGNAADNTLSGGAGNDHYRFGGGYGQDTIHDVDLTVGNIDTVVMDAGIVPGAVAVSQAAGQIVLSLNVHDQLRIDWDIANGIGVERVEFANGTVWDAAELAARANNHAPTVAHPLANQAATEDSAFNLTAPADTFADVDSGDSLSYSATQADNSPMPAWLAFNPATRGFSGTPLNGDVGVLSLKLTATDLWGASAATSFTVTVANTNDAPTVAHPVADQAVAEKAAFNFTVSADTFADVDAGDMLSYQATRADGSALPAWLAFNAATRTFSGTPQRADVGVLNVKITATDSANASVADTFTLSVASTNHPPTRPRPKTPALATPCPPTPSPTTTPATA